MSYSSFKIQKCGVCFGFCFSLSVGEIKRGEGEAVNVCLKVGYIFPKSSSNLAEAQILGKLQRYYLSP